MERDVDRVGASSLYRSWRIVASRVGFVKTGVATSLREPLLRCSGNHGMLPAVKCITKQGCGLWVTTLLYTENSAHTDSTPVLDRHAILPVSRRRFVHSDHVIGKSSRFERAQVFGDQVRFDAGETSNQLPDIPNHISASSVLNGQDSDCENLDKSIIACRAARVKKAPPFGGYAVYPKRAGRNAHSDGCARRDLTV